MQIISDTLCLLIGVACGVVAFVNFGAFLVVYSSFWFGELINKQTRSNDFVAFGVFFSIALGLFLGL